MRASVALTGIASTFEAQRKTSAAHTQERGNGSFPVVEILKPQGFKESEPVHLVRRAATLLGNQRGHRNSRHGDSADREVARAFG
ncbi:MAG: hypothetical protein A2847_01565 [Candidatus Sungbacteria bacterium RIFCSPHIGHO2_01_FULL_50_25]|uniref:Uncharacterized protein n=1 Tax=Candidatus Sungbacteria bacterium RIFCSPHIGHO2_01_FULL_50_25 TaxID=1802265 RepID=A0A1G2KBT3_9BACT|nr:MAG: hypothetical protein A2847_01565 [Candidatus Sungbacteria bacterium RIFCSPHIGHO2_01_FULL_50_25]